MTNQLKVTSLPPMPKGRKDLLSSYIQHTNIEDRKFFFMEAALAARLA